MFFNTLADRLSQIAQHLFVYFFNFVNYMIRKNFSKFIDGATKFLQDYCEFTVNYFGKRHIIKVDLYN